MIFERSISPYERFGTYRPPSDATLTVHEFRAGDSLSGLAHRYYNDWRKWRIIADRNKIVDPRQIAVGTSLLIPQLPPETGFYTSF